MRTKKPRTLYKTTITIWSETDPSETELEDLANEATEGMALCSGMHTETLTGDALEKDEDFGEGVESFFFGTYKGE